MYSKIDACTRLKNNIQTMPPIDCGGRTFASKKALEDHVRTILREVDVTESIKAKNPAQYNFLLELFRRHPGYPDKIVGMTDLAIQPNRITPQDLEVNLVKEGKLEAISWRQCVNAKGKDHYKIALRSAITEQIQRYKSAHPATCEMCSTSSREVDYHVDHINHFEEILNAFHESLESKGLHKPTEFINRTDNRKGFRAEDSVFEDAWKQFHEETARLRILCAPCNLRRPRWSPVSV